VQRNASGLQFVGVRKDGALELLKIRRGQPIPLGWIARASDRTFETLRINCIRQKIKTVKGANGRSAVPFGVGVKMLKGYDAFNLKLGTKATKAVPKKRSAKKK
jgi:hypothetical protein